MKLPIESVQHDSEFDFCETGGLWFDLALNYVAVELLYCIVHYWTVNHTSIYTVVYLDSALTHVWQCWLGIKCQSQYLSEVTIFIVLSVLCAHSCLEHLSPPREFVCIAVSVYACKYTYMCEIHVQVHTHAWDLLMPSALLFLRVCVQVHTHAWDSFMPSALPFLCTSTQWHMCEIHLCHQHCCFCVCVQVHTHAWFIYAISVAFSVYLCKYSHMREILFLFFFVLHHSLLLSTHCTLVVCASEWVTVSAHCSFWISTEFVSLLHSLVVVCLVMPHVTLVISAYTVCTPYNNAPTYSAGQSHTPLSGLLVHTELIFTSSTKLWRGLQDLWCAYVVFHVRMWPFCMCVSLIRIISNDLKNRMASS